MLTRFLTDSRPLVRGGLLALPLSFLISLQLGYQISPDQLLLAFIATLLGEIWVYYYFRAPGLPLLPAPALICLLAGVALALTGYITGNLVASSASVLLALIALAADMVDSRFVRRCG